jgi:hypothetical protein
VSRQAQVRRAPRAAAARRRRRRAPPPPARPPPRRRAPPPARHLTAASTTRSGDDQRYLVIFKDTALKTIRDLAQTHVPMLEHVRRAVRAWLAHHDPGDYVMYFHFMPSVFQLHLHVRRSTCCRTHVRIQPIQNVIANLRKTPDHYQNALILTKFCKKLQKAETHTKIDLNI